METDLSASIIFTKKVPCVTAEYNTLSGMARKQTGLADYILRVTGEKGLKYRDVETRSNKGITHGYISKIISGEAKNVSVKKLLALARGLGVSEEEIFEAARGGSPHNDPDFSQSDFAALFFRYRDLTSDDKAEINRLIELVDREIDRRMGSNAVGGLKGKR